MTNDQELSEQNELLPTTFSRQAKIEQKNNQFLRTNNVAPIPNLSKEILTELLRDSKNNIIADKKHLAIRLTFWTAEGLTFAYVFFGETTTYLTEYLQEIGAKIGFNLVAMEYVEIGTIVTNGPFNAVVSLATIKMILEHIDYIKGDASLTKKILDALFVIPLQLAGTAIGCVSFLSPIAEASFATKFFSLGQILPNNAAGTDGIAEGSSYIGNIVKTRIQITRGTLLPHEYYKESIKKLFYNTNLHQKKRLIQLLKQIETQQPPILDYKTQALSLLLKRIKQRQEINLPQTLKGKVYASLLPSIEKKPAVEVLEPAHKQVLAAFYVDLLHEQTLPIGDESKMIIAISLTIAQFFALLGVMYLGNKALEESFLSGIEKWFLPYIVLGGMLLSFSLGLMKNLSPLRNNPVRTSDSSVHALLFSLLLMGFGSMLGVSWDGAAQALLKAVLREGLKLIFLTPFAAFVFNTLSVVFSNGLACLKLLLDTYVAFSTGIFKSDSMANAVLVDKLLAEAQETVSDVITDVPSLQHIIDSLPQLPEPPATRPGLVLDNAGN
jgi:hypothetical protein